VGGAVRGGGTGPAVRWCCTVGWPRWAGITLTSGVRRTDDTQARGLPDVAGRCSRPCPRHQVLSSVGFSTFRRALDRNGGAAWRPLLREPRPLPWQLGDTLLREPRSWWLGGVRSGG
jgi:hypothetical protein